MTTTYSLRTITPPRSSDLIALAQVQRYMSQPMDQPTLDLFTMDLIPAASSAMIEFIGIHPGRQRYEQASYGTYGFGYYSGGTGGIYGDRGSRRNLIRIPTEPGTLSINLNGEDLVEAVDLPGAPDSDWSHWRMEDAQIGQLYRPLGWLNFGALPGMNIIDRYYAGFLLPNDVSTWKPTTAYTVGQFVRATHPCITRFECTTAGTSGSSEPAWLINISDAGTTITDGSTTWTVRAAVEIPVIVAQWCWIEIFRAYNNRFRPAGMALSFAGGLGVGGVREEWKPGISDAELSPATMSGLTRLRAELGQIGVA